MYPLLERRPRIRQSNKDCRKYHHRYHNTWNMAHSTLRKSPQGEESKGEGNGRSNAGRTLIQVAGELLFFAPLAVIAFFCGHLVECLFVMFGLFIFKQFYLIKYHSHKWYICVAISYGVITLILLVTSNFCSQPILIMLLSSLVAYLNYYAGVIQIKLENYERIKPHYIELTTKPQINLYALSRDELYDLCKCNGLSAIESDIVVYKIIDQLKDCEIYNTIGYSKTQYFRIKKRIKENVIFKDI